MTDPTDMHDIYEQFNTCEYAKKKEVFRNSQQMNYIIYLQKYICTRINTFTAGQTCLAGMDECDQYIYNGCQQII